MTTVGTGSSGIGGGDGGERRVLPGRGDERRGRGAGADREDRRVEDGRVEAETVRGREAARTTGARARVRGRAGAVLDFVKISDGRGSVGAGPHVSGCKRFLWRISPRMRHRNIRFCGARAKRCATEF